jgi:hypothetical protein
MKRIIGFITLVVFMAAMVWYVVFLSSATSTEITNATKPVATVDSNIVNETVLGVLDKTLKENGKLPVTVSPKEIGKSGSPFTAN